MNDPNASVGARGETVAPQGNRSEPALQQFWNDLLRTAVRATDAVAAAAWVCARDRTEWRCLAAWPGKGQTAMRLRNPELAAAVDEAEGRWSGPLPDDPDVSALGVRLALPSAAGKMVLAVARPPVSADRIDGLLEILGSVAWRVNGWYLEKMLTQARADVVRFSDILDLLAVLNARDKFMAAAMTLCNEIASRLKAGRVSLGWLGRGYIRVRAISHMEKFDKKMDAVQALEAAMEEAFEQDCEIVWPTEDDTIVNRDHAHYGAQQVAGHVVSVPLRGPDGPVAVLTVERNHPAFGDGDLKWLRLCADQAAPRMITLETRDVWFGLRLWRWIRKRASGLLGVEHTGARLIAVAAVAALGFLFFGRWPHHIKGDFSLHPDRAVILPAPFDGYLDAVHAVKGDALPAGSLLATLDVRDLLIERVSAAADLSRYVREAEKSRAEGDLAGMRLADAMADQARARLELIDYRIGRAQIVAPFEGAVVEGDLRERIGSPVNKGDVLFKVAQLTDLAVEVAVDERDIDYVVPGARVGLVFAGRPSDTYDARVLRLDAMARTHEGANVFIAHCAIDTGEQAWWRPGMSGVARIDAGRRAPIWLLSRRTIDYLRLRWGW